MELARSSAIARAMVALRQYGRRTPASRVAIILLLVAVEGLPGSLSGEQPAAIFARRVKGISDEVCAATVRKGSSTDVTATARGCRIVRRIQIS